MQKKIIQSGFKGCGNRFRSALLLCFCFISLLFAVAAALTAGDCFFPNTYVPENTSYVLFDGESDDALRTADNILFAESNTSPRFRVSRMVQRLLLKPGSQKQNQYNRNIFAVLLTEQTIRSNIILFSSAAQSGTFSAQSRYNLILKTVLPVRAGPSCPA